MKLASQLFGDRMLVANATGCSSIYGGNLPTTPWASNDEGRGPAWSSSLFEDNAEFGLGFRIAVDQLGAYARALAQQLAEAVGPDLVRGILEASQTDEPGIHEQRQRVSELRERLARVDAAAARELETVADYLVRKSVWIVGGDGWAYDIGFGGLDHVLAQDQDVNVLVLDTVVGSSQTIAIAGGRLPLGTWQGIFFCEFDGPRSRKVHVRIIESLFKE